AAEPAQPPEERREERDHDDAGEHQLDRQPVAKEVEHHSSLRPRGMACLSESPEWLTPTAIFAATNTNKELRKMSPLVAPPQSPKLSLGKRRFNGDCAPTPPLTGH